MNHTDLPVPFQEMMKSLLGKEYDEYIKSFNEERLYGLRVNTSKVNPAALLDKVPYPLKPVAWVNHGFYYEETCRPAKDPYYYAGLYYLQEPSAMTPASLLKVVPGDMVLDLCAAPGGKSTELGVKLSGRGMLVANDISNSRAKALLKNLELFGIPNICVTSEPPDQLRRAFPEFFDKLLIDAPCSGEGMFRKDPDMVKSWLERGSEYYAKIQREIVLEAVELLKPGGQMLYSTCTFSTMENEGTIFWLLSQRPDMELVPLELFPGACDGVGLSGCIRLYPHKIRGEGHFLALLKKKGEVVQTAGSDAPGRSPEAVRPKGVAEFLTLVKKPMDTDRICILNDRVYYLPEGFHPKINIRYLRTGLLLGTLKKERFEPSQALAMALKQDEFAVTISFSRDDDRVIRYLKGETLSLREGETPIYGWCLICVDGYPLGFAKGSGMMIKNKYYPGWRWQ